MTSPISIDPGVFRPEAISAETREFNDQLEKLLAAVPPMTIAETRASREAGKGLLGQIVRLDWAQEWSVPGPAGEIPVRVLVPDVVRGVYLHYHGGGHCLGSHDMHDPALARIATNCQVAVVSVGYRLAPEHQYPAGPDDCEAAAVWLAKNAASEFGSDRLLIGGESAGATLSVNVLLRMRDRHSFTGFSGARLTYGCYDLFTPSAARWGNRNLILSTPIIHMFMENYLPAGTELHDPDVSSIRADLSSMPPALFTVGTMDPLLDDSLFMYARWLAAGNEAELAVYPGGVHAFDAFPIEIARQAEERGDEFLRRALAG